MLFVVAAALLVFFEVAAPPAFLGDGAFFFGDAAAFLGLVFVAFAGDALEEAGFFFGTALDPAAGFLVVALGFLGFESDATLSPRRNEPDAPAPLTCFSAPLVTPRFSA